MSKILGKHITFNHNTNFFLNLFLSGLSLGASLFLVINCNPLTGVSYFNVMGVEFFLDSLSIAFLFLNSIVYFFSVVYSYSASLFSFKLHSFVIFLIHILLVLAFSTSNLLWFYIFFEALLVPMFVLINIWGGRGRKFHAAYLFFFFTFASSIPILIGIVYIYKVTGTLCFFDFIYLKNNLNLVESSTILYLFFIGFMAKIPTMPFHIWLPEAHVEAPTIGSVVLAAIILKLGYYGLYRVMSLCTAESIAYNAPVFLTILIVSIFYAGLMAVRQTDLKKIVAYSSVVHMNFGMVGLFAGSAAALQSATFIMFSHGLISAAMFFCVGFLYDRYHTRNIMYFGGLVQYMPVFGILFFIVMIANMSFPGTCNFIGEVGIYAAFREKPIILLLLVMSSLPTTLFCIYTVVKVMFYQTTGFLKTRLHDVYVNEFSVLLFLVSFIILLGLFPNLLIILIGNAL